MGMIKMEPNNWEGKMPDFLKAQIFEKILIVLMTILIAVSGYFVRKSENNEKRIIELMETRAARDVAIQAMDKRVDQRLEELTRQIDLRNNSLEKQLAATQELVKMLLEKQK